MKLPAELPTAIAAAEADETRVVGYEKDLITFITDHGALALQFAIIVAIPVGLVAFEIGKRFGH